MGEAKELSNVGLGIVAGNLLLSENGELPGCRHCDGWDERGKCLVFEELAGAEDDCGKFRARLDELIERWEREATTLRYYVHDAFSDEDLFREVK